MLMCVDGTGPMSDREYSVAMQESFVRTIYNQSPLSNKRYYRGPDWSGTGPNLLRPALLAQRMKRLYDNGDDTIYLTGYSRGAAIVINAAALLKRHHIPVAALFLFDAVDRSFELEADFIPSNVRVAYHAVRSSQTGSRESFSNCGLRKEHGVILDIDWFFTTHGGMGGTPWGVSGFPGMRTTIEYAITTPAGRDRIMRTTHINEGGVDGATNVTGAQEIRGMNQVKNWMWDRLRKHGVLV